MYNFHVPVHPVWQCWISSIFYVRYIYKCFFCTADSARLRALFSLWACVNIGLGEGGGSLPPPLLFWRVWGGAEKKSNRLNFLGRLVFKGTASQDYNIIKISNYLSKISLNSVLHIYNITIIYSKCAYMHGHITIFYQNVRICMDILQYSIQNEGRYVFA